LWGSLGIYKNYEAGAEDVLWEELLDAAREDRNLLEFFMVNELNGSMSENLYTSPDWPSAEALAKSRLASEPTLPKRNL
jgi:hypothetical protein